MKQLSVVCGLPNAGKTTYSKQFKTVLHYDDLSRMPKAERDRIFRTTDVECIEGIFNTRESRRKFIQNRNYDRRVCIWLDTPVDECIRRETRHRDEMFFRMCGKHFEPPTYEEGWDEIIHIKGGIL